MAKKTGIVSLLSLGALLLLTGCGGSSQPPAPEHPLPAALSTANANLIFVVSEDLAYHADGDLNAETANLTSRGLQRSLRLATFLQEHVLGSKPVTHIYALEPTTHLQTASQLPDMVPLESVQQLAVMNQLTMWQEGHPPYTANSFPLNVSYSPSAKLPDGVAQPLIECDTCQGLDFRNEGNDNEALAHAIISANDPGFYVFSAPWETISTLLASIQRREGYHLNLPAEYAGPNVIYAISITPSGEPSFVTYDSSLDPPSTYPAPPLPTNFGSACKAQPFHVNVKGGVGGAVVPAGVNTDETVYLIRHAEAHPVNYFEDGNYVGAGQWRALELPNALLGKINPDMVYSIDPAQATPGAESAAGQTYSYVRVSMTVAPYAIANNLPFYLASDFDVLEQNPPQLATIASEHIFMGGRFSHRKLLVAWEHDHIPPTINALLAAYHGGQTVPDWPDSDYDTVWTVRLDRYGNLSIDNHLCEGINSAALPATPPQF